ncbi:MAG: Rpn family recombination-promoting nuclease/putative transposase [Vulcanimicrobiota bacterium]
MSSRTPDLREAQNDLVRISLRNDIVFKYVFGHEKNEKILRALLNALLNQEGEQKIESLIFPNPVNLKTYLNAKHSCLDVRAQDGTGKRYNIEMQVRGGTQYIARTIYYHLSLAQRA